MDLFYRPDVQTPLKWLFPVQNGPNRFLWKTPNCKTLGTYILPFEGDGGHQNKFFGMPWRRFSALKKPFVSICHGLGGINVAPSKVLKNGFFFTWVWIWWKWTLLTFQVFFGRLRASHARTVGPIGPNFFLPSAYGKYASFDTGLIPLAHLLPPQNWRAMSPTPHNFRY